MRTYQFFYEVEGEKILFNLPEDRSWAEADKDPALTIEVIGGDEDTLILANGNEIDVANII